MDLKQLKYFIKVAELGSYTKAAEQFNVPQPLLSRQIRQLEVELKQNLFIRNGRGVCTTEAGNILLKHSYAIFAQLDNLQEDLNLAQGKISGTITLGIPPTLSKLFAKNIIRRFYSQLPEANLVVVEAFTANLQERITNNRLNVALLHNPPFQSGIDYDLLTQVQLELITRKDNPLAQKSQIELDDFQQIPLILPTQGNTFRQLFDNEMTKLHRKSNVVLEVDSKELVLDLVEDGLGNSILLPMVLALGQAHPQLTAVKIAQPQLPCHLYMATANKTKPSRLQTALVKIIKDVCLCYFPNSNSKNI
ncbi:LysR family transcriptional regulator [Lonepinella koalarum]|uniref:LysR family transcriptional regulator n=1 Tax=Lonepinella koalarum TaxID=53417 RepID=UPI003F6DF077